MGKIMNYEAVRKANLERKFHYLMLAQMKIFWEYINFPGK